MTSTKHPRAQSASTRAELLYALLSDRKWHDTEELVDHVGHTFAQAKWRLVRLGYSIECRRTSSKLFAYRLPHTPHKRPERSATKAP